MTIREFNKDEDFEEVCRWARHHFDVEPQLSQFSPTSFIVEVEDGATRAAVVSILLTNSKHYCIAECLLSNPDLEPRVVKAAVEYLSTYVEAFAKALEYKGLFCMAPTKVLTRRYKSLGFHPTMDGITTMYKGIGGV